MDWIAKCVYLCASGDKGEPPIHSARLRGAAPALDLVVNSPEELPFHLGEEYIVTLEPVQGAFV